MDEIHITKYCIFLLYGAEVCFQANPHKKIHLLYPRISHTNTHTHKTLYVFHWYQNHGISQTPDTNRHYCVFMGLYRQVRVFCDLPHPSALVEEDTKDDLAVSDAMICSGMYSVGLRGTFKFNRGCDRVDLKTDCGIISFHDAIDAVCSRELVDQIIKSAAQRLGGTIKQGVQRIHAAGHEMPN